MNLQDQKEGAVYLIERKKNWERKRERVFFYWGGSEKGVGEYQVDGCRFEEDCN